MHMLILIFIVYIYIYIYIYSLFVCMYSSAIFQEYEALQQTCRDLHADNKQHNNKLLAVTQTYENRISELNQSNKLTELDKQKYIDRFDKLVGVMQALGLDIDIDILR